MGCSKIGKCDTSATCSSGRLPVLPTSANRTFPPFPRPKGPVVSYRRKLQGCNAIFRISSGLHVCLSPRLRSGPTNLSPDLTSLVAPQPARRYYLPLTIPRATSSTLTYGTCRRCRSRTIMFPSSRKVDSERQSGE